jgi:hypothetical protein
MAAEEARQMLDALMGGDRNAPLPPGAAVPRRGGRGGGDLLLLPGKKARSCYDPDIDPLYTAWGVDVFELFVNTKSDLGVTNPYVADPDAHAEYKALPPTEQARLGYDYFLFQKLSELTRQCDRVVSRNKEKLRQEIARKQSQSSQAAVDYVENVDPQAVELLARNIIQKEDMEVELANRLGELDALVAKETTAKTELGDLFQKPKQSDVEPTPAVEESGVIGNNKVKEEQNGDSAEAAPESEPQQHNESDAETKVEPEVKREDESVKDEEEKPSPDAAVPLPTSPVDPELQALQLQLGRVTLDKQKTLYDLARLVARLAALEESVESQTRQLNYVRSDISTDKTVCEVSGNFMSARDADERIAAHYAGKQYVGWKLVRDKLASMIQQYGRYGPPPPSSRGPPPPSAMNAGPAFSGGRGGAAPPPSRGHGSSDGGDRGFRDRGGSGGFGRGGGGYQDRGRPAMGGPPPRGNWRR